MGAILFLLEMGSLLPAVWELPEQARLASQRALEICLSLFFQYEDCTLTTPEFWTGVLRTDLGSSCLYITLDQSSYLPKLLFLLLSLVGTGASK